MEKQLEIFRVVVLNRKVEKLINLYNNKNNPTFMDSYVTRELQKIKLILLNVIFLHDNMAGFEDKHCVNTLL